MLRLLVEHRYRLLWVALALCLAGTDLYRRTPVELLPRTTQHRFAVMVSHTLAPESRALREAEEVIRLEAARLATVREAHAEISPSQILETLTFEEPPFDLASHLARNLSYELRRRTLPSSVQVAVLGPESVSVVDLVVESKTPLNAQAVGMNAVKKLSSELLRLEEVALVQLSGQRLDELKLQPKPGQIPLDIQAAEDLAQALAPPRIAATRAFGSLILSRGLSSTDISGAKPTPSLLAGNSTMAEFFSIHHQEQESETTVFSNGKPAVLAKIFKTESASEIGTSQAVRALLEKVKKNSPELEIHIVGDAANYINAAQDNVVDNLKWAVILTCLCILALAKNLRYTIIVSLSIPLSLLLSFPFFYFLDISRNIMSLAGMTLSVGVVVDATISVIDSLDEGMAAGLSPREAAVYAGQENLTPVLLTSLTTLAVFVPILFLKGSVGDLFRDLSLTVIISQVVSFLVAIFLVPSLTSMIYEPLQAMNLLHFENKNSEKDNIWARLFLSLVRHATSSRLSTWASASVLLLLVVWSMTLLPPSEFLPQRVTNELRIIVNLDELNTRADRRELAMKLDKSLKEMGGKERLLTAERNTLIADAILTTKERTLTEIERAVATSLPGHRVVAAFRNPLDPEASQGHDLDFMIPISALSIDIFRESLSRISGISHIAWSHQRQRYQTLLPTRTGPWLALPTLPQDASSLLQFIYSPTLVGVLRPTADQIAPVPVFLQQNTHSHPVTRAALPPTLAPFAREMHLVPDTNHFLNGVEMLQVKIQIRGRTTTEAASDIDNLAMHTGTTIVWGDSHSENKRSLFDLGISLAIAGVITVLILLAQNHSIATTTVILFTFIWGLIGSIPGLTLHHETLNASALVGFILLAGTIVNNGILLVDIIERSRKHQVPPLESCLLAVRQRTVPVLVTALTTAIGMIPMAFDVGEGSQMYRALSVVVVYGTIVSTPISLVGIPCLVLIMGDIAEAMHQTKLRLALYLYRLWPGSKGEQP